MWNWLNNARQSLGNLARQDYGATSAENIGQLNTTGNKFRDIAIGGIAGIGAGLGNQRQLTYPVYNYKGHGLASSTFMNLDNPYQINASELAAKLSGNLRNWNWRRPTTYTNNQIATDALNGNFEYAIPASIHGEIIGNPYKSELSSALLNQTRLNYNDLDDIIRRNIY